jgi:hypothetical protein
MDWPFLAGGHSLDMSVILRVSHDWRSVILP